MRRLLLPLLACLLVAAPSHAAGDPRLREQHALTQLRAPQAWARTQGRGVVVAVVDTGVDTSHPDLRGRLVPGATFLQCGSSPCGNGDWRSGPSERRTDAFGHGTAVAGVVVAGRGNGVGIVGVAPLAKVMPVKIGDSGPIDYADVAAGVRWATAHGADVINLSLGLAPTATDVAAAVNEAVAKGVVVVAASGNSARPVCADPAAVPDVICVTATDRDERPSLYSSGGVKPGLRSLAAPGGGGLPSPASSYVPYGTCGDRIVTTWPVREGAHASCGGTGYRYLYGTSLSAPYVAGVAALLLAQGRTARNVVDVLVSTARTPGAGTGVWTPQYGHGIVDAAAAVAAPR